MARTVRHFSLHRLGDTELQVVSEIEVGTLPVIAAEEAVIRGYAAQGPWPHRSVTLFLLQDLQPLVRRLQPGADLPPGGAAALDFRPVVNAYDLADLSSCHLFLNWHALQQEQYADDPLAIQGLLAHEHGHPLAENETTRASRRLRAPLAVQSWPGVGAEQGGGWLEQGDRREKLESLLALLGDTLCAYAPREVFASEVAARRGFAASLLHLNRRNLANTRRGLAGREKMRGQLRQEVSRGNLPPTAADLLLLVGDLKGYVDLGLEAAAFYRAGCQAEAEELEGVLQAEVFPHLEPQVPRLYAALREQYVALRPDLTPAELKTWGRRVLKCLTEALAEDGLLVRYSLRMANP